MTADCVLHQPRWPRDTAGRDAIVEETRTNQRGLRPARGADARFIPPLRASEARYRPKLT
ncbi:MAG: hypothetical protein ABEH64_00695 [Salinirussus sp.]